jgi:hypothetical protein
MALDTQPMETVTVSGGRQFGSDRVTLIFRHF